MGGRSASSTENAYLLQPDPRTDSHIPYQIASVESLSRFSPGNMLFCRDLGRGPLSLARQWCSFSALSVRCGRRESERQSAYAECRRSSGLAAAIYGTEVESEILSSCRGGADSASLVSSA